MGETCKGQTCKLTRGSQPGWALWKHSNGTDAFSLTKVWGQLQFSGPIENWQKHFPGEKVQVLRFSRVPNIRGDSKSPQSAWTQFELPFACSFRI